MSRDCANVEERCIPWAIVHYANHLADASYSKGCDEKEVNLPRNEALKFLGHFVGDLHQPLHAGHKKDFGGNSIKVSFFGDPGEEDYPMNLHRVWDGKILGKGGLYYKKGNTSLNDSIDPQAAKKWANFRVLDWTNEAYHRAEQYAYTLPSGKQVPRKKGFKNGYDVRWPYQKRAFPVVREAILQAGVRLAFLINQAAAGKSVPD